MIITKKMAEKYQIQAKIKIDNLHQFKK